MFKKIISKIARTVILNSGYAERIAFESMRTELALRRLQKMGLEVNSVFDIGASNGSWSIDVCTHWPEARFHLIEANKRHEDELSALCQRRRNFSYKIAAASDAPGTVYFDDSDLFGGLAMKNRSASRAAVAIPAVTLDSEASVKLLVPPFLVKLDTHGFEVPILIGGKATLAAASLVIIEAYNFKIEPDSLKFYELCKYMDNLGFGVIDVSEPLWRAKDSAFWQIDIFFVPKRRPELAYIKYA